MRQRENDDGLEEMVVKVKRCTKVVKGGKRLSFAALVVVGDRKGKVGYGYGKANEVPFAVEKAIKEAKDNLIAVPIVRTTIPYTVTSKFSATSVLLRPAAAGTGTKAGAAARAVLELAGVRDILSKVSGSTNPTNVVKATIECLRKLRTKKEYEELKALKVE